MNTKIELKMSLKIRELKETYPYFDFLSFMGIRPRTFTEKLLDMDLSFCSRETEKGWRDYLFLNLHPSAKEEVFEKFFPKENMVYNFTFKGLEFKGVRKDMFIYSVCMLTYERVCFGII